MLINLRYKRPMNQIPNFDFNWALTPLWHSLSLHKACLPLTFVQRSARPVQNWNNNNRTVSHYFTFLAMHSGKSVFILCGKHVYPGNNKTIFKSPARQKSQPKTSLALVSYVQTNQFATYCLLETSSRCAELGRDVIHVIRWMRVSLIVPEARFFEQRAPI